MFVITGAPQYLSVDKDTALTGTVIHILLQSLQCTMQIISPWNCESLKPPLESFSKIDHAVIVMSNNY